MNPSNDPAGGQGAKPVPGMTPPPAQNPAQNPAQPAVPPMTLPLPPTPPQDLPGQPPAMPAPGQNPIPAAPQIDAQSTTPMATPQVVDDGDLIEKEWVSKAKQIVEKNRNDPYKQSEELTVFRADYMKKRYNKNIKVDK